MINAPHPADTFESNSVEDCGAVAEKISASTISHPSTEEATIEGKMRDLGGTSDQEEAAAESAEAKAAGGMIEVVAKVVPAATRR